MPKARFPCGKDPARRPLAGAVRDQGFAGQPRTSRSSIAANLAQNRRKAAPLAHRGDPVQKEGNVTTPPTRAGWCATGKTAEACGNGDWRVLGEAGQADRPVGLWSLGVPHRSLCEPPFTAPARRNFLLSGRTALGQRGHHRRRSGVGRAAGSIGLRRGWLDPAEREIQIFFPDPV